MKKILLFVIISLTFISSKAITQNYVVDGVSPKTAICTDSVFYKFVKPNLPPKFYESILNNDSYDLTGLEVFICAYIDTSGKVKNLILQPIYSLHNELADTSFIWKYVLNSIDSVSKLWVFKPLLHKIKDEYPEDQKNYYREVNSGKSKATHRPFFGKQVHMFVLNINLPNHEIYNPNMFYLINLQYDEQYNLK